jgi:hypothetical protein
MPLCVVLCLLCSGAAITDDSHKYGAADVPTTVLAILM